MVFSKISGKQSAGRLLAIISWSGISFRAVFPLSMVAHTLPHMGRRHAQGFQRNDPLFKSRSQS
jgi:hypothetical protein